MHPTERNRTPSFDKIATFSYTKRLEITELKIYSISYSDIFPFFYIKLRYILKLTEIKYDKQTEKDIE